ncbi:MAG: cytochrome c [Acidobacteria bacterium]|nr:cytochrome c [Acidobacteriota bacterium]
MRLRLLIAAIVLLTGISLIACEREERGFRVQTPDTNRVNNKQLVDLQAGQPSKTPDTPNDYENNAQALADGKQLFQQMNCTGCHAHGGGSIGPALMDDKWIYGNRPEQIFSTIVEGRPNGMPSFRGKLPDYKVWQLAAYVRSLSGQAPSHAAPGRDDDLQVGKPENSQDKKKPQNSTASKSAEAPQ